MYVALAAIGLVILGVLVGSVVLCAVFCKRKKYKKERVLGLEIEEHNLTNVSAGIS